LGKTEKKKLPVLAKTKWRVGSKNLGTARSPQKKMEPPSSHKQKKEKEKT